MPRPMQLGDFELHWLEGGVFEIDGGAMFGVVPKVLWQKKCAPTPDNYVRVADSPILIKTPAGNVLIETGLGNKLTAKQQEIFRLRREWDLPGSLAALGLKRDDIHHVILTHGDFDHAGGIVMYNSAGAPELTFPAATHYFQKSEWEDIRAPNRRSACSYFPVNFEGLVEGKNLRLVDDKAQVVPGVRLERTGGHTRGHQLVRLSSGNNTGLHLGDLLPTTAYTNPLWITPYDNFPLESIAAKEAILPRAVAANSWFLFYHEPEILACKFDNDFKMIEVFMRGEENGDQPNRR